MEIKWRRRERLALATVPHSAITGRHQSFSARGMELAASGAEATRAHLRASFLRRCSSWSWKTSALLQRQVALSIEEARH